MKRLVMLVLLLCFAVWFGLQLPQERGMIIISVAGWRVDLPLWFGIVLMILTFILIYYLFLLYDGIINTNASIKNRTASSRSYRSKNFSKKGFLAFVQGDYSSAEHDLVQGAKHNDMSWLNYLFAAKAAIAQGAEKRQNEYYLLAKEAAPDTEFAVLIAQATEQYENGQYEKSLQTLSPIIQSQPYHPGALKLQQKITLHLNDWKSLASLLLIMKRKRIYPKEKILEIGIQCWTQALSSQQATLSELEKRWKSLPKALQQQGDIALAYAKNLQRLHKPVEASAVIHAALKYQWREDLIRFYGTLTHPEPQKLLAIGENWLPKHPNSPGLLLTLGRLCEQLQLWGKAQHYLEASLSLQPDPQTYAQLGLLLEKMNNPQLGSDYFKKGLLLATDHD